MKLERADQVVGWLRSGRRYLVPTVRGEWLDTHGVGDWPVVGYRHKDPELGVNVSHYHIDHRFIAKSEWSRDTNTVVNESNDAPVRYIAWKCLQESVVLRNVTNPAGFDLQQAWRGRQCEGSAKAGWVCPHRGAWLGSQLGVDGTIVCPGHGLMIDAKTGQIL